MGKLIDLTGQRFGRLVVVERAGSSQRGEAMWRCLCDCKKEIVVRSGHFISGATKSCGCMRNERVMERNIERNTTHGKSKTRLYRIWARMIQRCCNPNHPRYADYGGRGITICAEWRQSFAAFQKWALASGYQDDLSIDRIDNDGNYEPFNCRWADAKQQNRNRRSNHLITHNGQTKTATEWAEQLHIKRQTLTTRLEAGWSVEKALETSVESPRK